MRVRVERVERERLEIAGVCLREPSEIVVDVAQVKMRLEEIGLQTDRALVKRLSLRQLIAAVVNVGEVDERSNQVRVQLERLAICARCRFEVRLVPVVNR